MIEYVSIKEFADQLGYSLSAIYAAVTGRPGRVPVINAEMTSLGWLIHKRELRKWKQISEANPGKKIFARKFLHKLNIKKRKERITDWYVPLNRFYQ